MNRRVAVDTLNDTISREGSGHEEWLRRTKSNNSFNPTLASELFIIKLGGFCYVASSALASVGLIRALGPLRTKERESGGGAGVGVARVE